MRKTIDCNNCDLKNTPQAAKGLCFKCYRRESRVNRSTPVHSVNKSSEQTPSPVNTKPVHSTLQAPVNKPEPVHSADLKPTPVQLRNLYDIMKRSWNMDREQFAKMLTEDGGFNHMLTNLARVTLDDLNR